MSVECNDCGLFRDLLNNDTNIGVRVWVYGKGIGRRSQSAHVFGGKLHRRSALCLAVTEAQSTRECSLSPEMLSGLLNSPDRLRIAQRRQSRDLVTVSVQRDGGGVCLPSLSRFES